MRKTLPGLLLFLHLVLTGTWAHAQLSLAASGAYGIPTGPESSGVFGGGLAAKYYLSSKMAVGVRVRTYLETVKQDGNGLNGRLMAVTIPMMGTFEYHITDTDLHPYAGLELGLVHTTVDANLSFNGKQIYDDLARETTFGLAPKLGVGYDLTQGLTVMAEALYNIGFGKNQAGDTRLSLTNSARFLAFHAGISFTFGNRFDPDRRGAGGSGQ